MKRITYLLRDERGIVRARMVIPEGDGVVPEPWMVHNINSRGWLLEAWEIKDSGIQMHGWADWKGVADDMATALRAVLSYAEEAVETDEEGQALLEQVRMALDNYHVAEMEVSVAEPSAEIQREEDDDGE